MGSAFNTACRGLGLSVQLIWDNPGGNGFSRNANQAPHSPWVRNLSVLPHCEGSHGL